MSVIHLLYLVAAISVAGPVASTAPGSTDHLRSRVFTPAERRAFYRSGGRELLGRKIQLWVEAKVLRRTAEMIPLKRGAELLIFENRSVPICIHSRSAYWKQARRHLRDAGGFALKGVLRVRPNDPRRRIHLYVTRIKRAAGSW